MKPFVLFDEVEIFTRLPAEFSRDFCEALRVCATAGQLVLITASRSPLRELHRQGALVSPWYNIMGALRLGPFSDTEAREFVAVRRPGVQFTNQQVAEVLRRGDGHPLRLQVLCWHLAQAKHQQRRDMAALWREAEAEAREMLEPDQTALVSR